MPKTLVLLDVDGVLIRGRGYRASLQAAFQHLCQRMGQNHIIPPQEAAILAFEAQSIIFEWDSAAICMAALLNQVPQFLADSLENSIQQIAQANIQLAQPDFIALAKACPPAQAGIRPAYATLESLFPQHPVFIELLADTHATTAPLLRLIQNFVLGDALFSQSYRLPAQVKTPSLLQTLDIPLLAPVSRERLRHDPTVYPVVYTARPSLPPSFVSETVGYAPEAELGKQLLEWEDVPLAAYGQMEWLARQAGLAADAYSKPSPMHARLGIFNALLYGTEDWERQAIDLTLGKSAIPEALKTDPWQVVVLEDSPNSIRGVREAVGQLSQVHDITVKGVGIASEPHNIAALSQIADYVAPDVNAGLAWALGW